MIDLRVKLFLKSLGESILFLLFLVGFILCVMGAIWALISAPVGVSIAVIVLVIIGALTRHQYKEQADKLKRIEKRIEEAKEEIFRLEDKIISMSDEADVNEMDLQYWNNVLKDARNTFNYLIQERRNLWRWNV